MRTIEEIQSELNSALSAFHEKAMTAIATESQASSKTIRALRAELSAAYSKGADVCPACKTPPLGMLRSPAYTMNERLIPAVYEVGCIRCPPVLVEIDGKKRRQSYSAHADSPAGAVQRWNNQEWVTDSKIDLIPAPR